MQDTARNGRDGGAASPGWGTPRPRGGSKMTGTSPSKMLSPTTRFSTPPPHRLHQRVQQCDDLATNQDFVCRVRVCGRRKPGSNGGGGLGTEQDCGHRRFRARQDPGPPCPHANPVPPEKCSHRHQSSPQRRPRHSRRWRAQGRSPAPQTKRSSA